LSCKAFDLDDAIKSFAPAVGPNTAILPLLNGMRHLESLDAKFGRERVLGGLCAIAVTLNEKREVIHLQPLRSLTFGERDGKSVRSRQRHHRCDGGKAISVRKRATRSFRRCGRSGFPRLARSFDLPDARVGRSDH